MPPNLATPISICKIPAINTAQRKRSKAPILVIAPKTNAAKPAAGPLTLSLEPLKEPITIPPMIPEIKPLKKGAPDAKEIPRHSGRATKKTTNPAGKSFFKYLKVNPFGSLIIKKLRRVKFSAQYVILCSGNYIRDN